MADNRRNTNVLLLICALIGAMIFFGCGGGTSSDPLPVGAAKTLQITGKVTSNALLTNVESMSAEIRAAIDAQNVEVYLESNRSAYSTRTDTQGNFSLTVPEGTHNIVALITTPSGKVFKVRSTSVTVSNSNPSAELTNLQLAQATSFITGMVKDASGNPMPNSKLSLWGETFYSGSDGKFTTPLMPSGVNADVKIVVPGYQETVLNIDFNNTNPAYIEQTIVPSASTNRAPIAGLKATTYEVSPRQQIELTGSATDPDGDTLSYNWSSTAGEIATRSTPNLAIWTAPDIQTTATITFMISDPSGLTAAANVAIKVGSGGTSGGDTTNYAPVILSIDTATSTFLNNADYTLTANATDSNGDALSYFWSAAQGSVSPTNEVSTTWRTPNVTDTTYVQVSVLVSDGKGGTANRTATFTVSTNPNPPANQTPVATILTPANGSLFAPGNVAYSGSATDPEDGALPETSFTWYQAKEGESPVMIGNQRSGLSLTVLEPATYTVTLQAADLLGAIGETTSSFRINSNPTAQITSPASGTVYQLGQAITFNGLATDVEDVTVNSASLTWTFPSGSTQTGSSVTKSDLTAGNNTIRFKGVDRIGAESSEVSIQVYINSNPTISAVGPASGSDYLSGDPVPFTVTAADPDETLASSSIIWKDGATILGQGTPLEVSTLTAGLHDITVTINDSMGGSVSSMTQVVINQRPTMTITSPANETVVSVDEPITFTGAGTSLFGTVSSSTMQWQDYYNNATTTLKTGEASFEYTYTGSNKFGAHIITLTGSDMYGASSYTQNIIYVNATPTVSIVSPASGTRFDLGETITFVSSKSDTDPTDTLTVRWLDDSTEIGTGDTLPINTLASGNHNIFCEVTDMHGVTNVASISVLVNSLPTGTVSWSTTQYATASTDIPVFISNAPSMEVNFSIDSYDAEIGGPIENYSADNIKWYSNIDGSLSQIGTGTALSTTLELGVSTITVRLYDTMYPDFEDQASSTYSTTLHVWQSVSYPNTIQELDGTGVFIEGDKSGNDATLYITFATPFTKELTYSGDIGAEFISQKSFYDLASTTIFAGDPFTSALGAVNVDGMITALGSTSGGQMIAGFTDEETLSLNPTNLNNGLVGATSISTNDTLIYITNAGNNSVIMVNPNTASITNTIYEANNEAFDSPVRVRFADQTYGKVFIADQNNNRVVRFSNEFLGTALTPIAADNPSDVAFTKSYLFSLDSSNSQMTVHNPANGSVMMQFGESGTGVGQFNSPVSIYSNGYDLFVIEANRMQIIRSGEADWFKP